MGGGESITSCPWTTVAEGLRHAHRRARAATQTNDALYLSIDMDAADAAFATGVSASGSAMTAREIRVVAAIAIPPTDGADVMEL